MRDSRFTSGLAFAAVSAASFGLSGTVARSLLEIGWSAGAAVTARITIAGLVLLLPAVWSLRGRWHTLANGRVWGAIVTYGLVAVAIPQLCYFYSVMTLQVAVALLIEYIAPVAVVVWMWARHGQRPTWLTAAGAVIAAIGLALILQVFGGVSLDAVGVAWALGAMLGAAGFFILSAHTAPDLPGIALASGGLLAAGLGLGLAGLLGVLPMAESTDDVELAGAPLPWWAAVALLALVTAALAYVTGIAATRRLGARLASFVALSEVVAAVIFAWALIGEVPTAVQLAGGALILIGVIVVKLGEREPIRPDELDLVDP
ncbi:DMT family transporter [Gordonia sp. PP30]|uniref:EamA family transporter n=1 Tax=Gordonia sp. PP30 TaxID=2935861 RepID=UPI001FFF5471|nr:DMT family transporter [Gordonia sp. PP30]UQE74484.1 DMT family transporter [Gordonia sp. PP30]